MSILTQSNPLAFTGLPISRRNLVAFFDAGNRLSYDGSSSTWRNLGSGANMSLVNSPTYETAFGGAVVFDGANTYTDSNQGTLDLSAGITAIIAVKFNSFSGGSFFAGSTTSYTDTHCNFYSGGSANIRWETIPFSSFSSNRALSTGQNFVIAGTFAGVSSNGASNVSSIWINGILDKSQTVTGNASGAFSVFQLGRYPNFGNFNGSMYAFLFYNRCLTPQEISQTSMYYKRKYGAS